MKRWIGVDLGKTACRVSVSAASADAAPRAVEGPGAPGLADHGGVPLAVDVVVPLVLRATDADVDGGYAGLLVGAAGAGGGVGAREQADELASGLVSHLRHLRLAEVAVTSDAITAHAGALGGRAGVVLAVGTGSVVVGVSAEGQICTTDGWGPWLGDDGGGAWLGREGLRAVLKARERRGATTTLTGVAEKRFDDLGSIPRRLAGSKEVARSLAGFAPEVIAAADRGDAVAVEIVTRAAASLADLTVAAARNSAGITVAVIGGLSASATLMAAWRAALPDDLEVVPAQGSALDGALLLARVPDLPHEQMVHRVAISPPLDADASRPRGAPPADQPNPVDVDTLATEQVRAGLADLDLRPTEALVSLLLGAEADVPAVLRSAAPALSAVVDLAAAAIMQGGRIVYVGAGTPGRLAALDAAECPPTFGIDPDRVVAVLAGGDEAAGRAVEGAEDDEYAGARQLKALDVGRGDLVVGITASGRTPYVLSALAAARDSGADTAAIVNNPGSPARQVADITIELLTGAEVLAGSTRLTAGTSQKIALNTISTSAMIKAGKTFGPWMVDVKASNEKLRRRARRIVRDAAGVADGVAGAMLARCDGHAKTAIVALLTGLEPADAQARLHACGGRVRAAVEGGAPR